MKEKRFHKSNILLVGFSLFACFSCSSSDVGLSIEDAKEVVSSLEKVSYTKYSYEAEITCLGLETYTKTKHDEDYTDCQKVEATTTDAQGQKVSLTSYMGREGLEGSDVGDFSSQAILYSRSPFFRLPLHLKEESFYVLDGNNKLLANDCAYGLIYTKFIDSSTLAKLSIEKNDLGGFSFFAKDSDKYTIFRGAYDDQIVAIAHFNFSAVYDKNGYLVEESAVTTNYKGTDTDRTIRSKTTFTYAL